MKRFDIALFAFLFMTVFTFVGCGGDEPVVDEPDTTNPTLSITKPASGDVFHLGDVVYLSGELKDNEGLKSVTISVTYNGEKSVSIVPDEWVAEYFSAISGALVPYADFSVFTVPDNILPGSYTITIVVEDTSGNIYTFTIEITIEE